MAHTIPTETIDEILDKLNIAEVISSYIPLKRAGRNLKASCPFHHEKTPSFIVSPDKQIYHCFGCGAGGNTLNFVMQYERVEFLEALKILAKKSGVEIKHLSQNVDKGLTGAKAGLYKINELASLFYHKNLLTSPQAKSARSYLSRRAVSKDMAKQACLGFAPDSWDGLLEHLKSKGINPSFINRIGLLIAKDRGGFYDRFRNRIIFPIFDVKSKIVGFGGRGIDDKITPKYLNSPETPLYTKGKHLYGLNLSKDKIREKDLCLIVEGYLDFLIPYSKGIDNIVASLGTALTKDQIRLIKRYTHKVVIIYDGDASGEMAMLRSLDLFIEQGLSVKVVTLDEDLDPDIFVRKFGADAFRAMIAEAKNLFDFKLDFLKRCCGDGDIEQKARIIEEMLLTINKFSNALVKADYIKQLAEELNVPESAIMEEAKKIKSKNARDYTEQYIKGGKTKNTLGGLQNQERAFESLLVQLMLQEKEILHQMKDRVSASDFHDKHLSKIVQTMFELTHMGKSITPNKLLTFLADPDIAATVCRLSATDEIVADKDKITRECVLRLKKEAIKTARHQLSKQIKDAQNINDEERLACLLREFNLLAKKKVANEA